MNNEIITFKDLVEENVQILEDVDHECLALKLANVFNEENHIGYSDAISHLTYVVRKKGWFATKGEYGTRIDFCPFCGIELSTIKN